MTRPSGRVSGGGRGRTLSPATVSDSPRRAHSGIRRSLFGFARVVVIIATLAGCFVGVSLTVQPARAAPLSCAIGGGENANLGPERLGGGATAWIPFLPQEDVRTAPDDPYLRVASNHTLWEVVGPRGLLWSYTPQAVVEGGWKDNKKPSENLEEKCSLMDGAGT